MSETKQRNEKRTTLERFIPKGDRLLIEIDKTPEKTPTGIFLPDSVREDKQTARVISAGLDSELRGGETIVYAKFSGTEIELDGETYLIIDDEDVLGYLDE